MTLTQLTYFRKIAEVENLSVAAEILHVSQPSLSYSIKELERELNTDLFQKEGRNIRITNYGRTFLTYAIRALESIDEGRQMLSALSNQMNSEIKIGAITIMGIGYVPRMINKFYDIHMDRNFNINIEQQEARRQSTLLKQGESEIAFGPYLEDSDIEIKELYKEQVMLAVSKCHPLAERDSVRFEDFKNENLITFLHPAGIRKQIDNYFLKRNTEPNILYEVRNELMIVGLVESNLGVALLPCSAEEDYSSIKLLQIEDSTITRPLYIMRLKNVPLKKLANEFWNFVVSNT